MGQYTESQYDDDLTVGVDEYDDFVQTDNVDLFEFYGEEESTIAKLKTIILSIDWEITNENLSEFNSELLVLKESLPGDNINLVYAQALEKICKYIYKEKSNSNHNAIKLLQSFFYTLEKNLTSDSVTDEEKKAVLIEDVKQFERLKSQIGGKGTTKSSAPAQVPPAPPTPKELSPNFSEESIDQNSPLLKLKAIILGMDWEITEKELTELGQEVKRLEKHFKDSRPKLIFLQGIGVLGAYIKNKKSDSHADVFKLLHSFADNLNKIVSNSYSYDEEKQILLPEVEKFNKFKAMIADTIDGQRENSQESYEEEQYENIAPAFADMDEGVSGFHEEEEVAAITTTDPSLSIDNQIDSFFGGLESSTNDTLQEVVEEKESDTVLNMFGEENSANDEPDVDVALRGVDVETEADDESDEEPLPLSETGEFAPALVGDDEPGFAGEENTGSWASSDEANEIFEKLEGFFDDAEDATNKEEDVKVALQGVDVETEADDESEEEPLPLSDSGEFAPAFSDFEDNTFSSDTQTDETELVASASDTDDVSDTLDKFFGEDDTNEVLKAVIDEPEDIEQESFEPALAGFDSSDSSDIDSDIDKLFGDDDENQFSFAEDVEEDDDDEMLDREELAPALFDEDIVDENDFSSGVEDTLDSFFAEDDEPAPALELTQEDEVVAEAVVDTPAQDVVHLAEEDAPALFQGFDKGDEATVEDLSDIQNGEDDLDLFAADDEPAVDTAESVSAPFGVENDVQELFSDFDEIEPATSEDTIALVDDEEEVIFEVIADDSDETGSDEEVLTNDGFNAVFDEVIEEVIEEETVLEETISIEESIETPENDELTVEVDMQEEDLLEESVTTDIEEEGELTLTENEQEEDLEEYFKNTGLGDSEQDDLAGIRVGVSSIGVELEDGILDSLAAEIRELGQKWEEKLVGKTLLQLMSTILRHINQYRFEASSDSHDMLLSIFDKIEVIHRGDMDSVEEQQILLTETSKVLLWQQVMLDRQAVKKGDTLTFMDPIRSDGSIDQKVGEFVFTEDDIVAEDEGDIFSEESLMVDQDVPEEAIDQSRLEAEVDSTIAGATTTNNSEITNVIREEMNSLRESLQAEIESLRKDLGKS